MIVLLFPKNSELVLERLRIIKNVRFEYKTVINIKVRKKKYREHTNCMEIGNLFVKVTSWDKREQLKSNTLHGCCHSIRTLGGFWTLKLVFFMFRLIRFIRKFVIVISFSCWLAGFLVVGIWEFFVLVCFVVLFVCFFKIRICRVNVCLANLALNIMRVPERLQKQL